MLHNVSSLPDYVARELKKTLWWLAKNNNITTAFIAPAHGATQFHCPLSIELHIPLLTNRFVPNFAVVGWMDGKQCDARSQCDFFLLPKSCVVLVP